MFSFLHRPKQTTDRITPEEGAAPLLRFEPCRIVSGITFHLLEERKALSVDADSAHLVIEKLEERGQHLSISTDQWARMENMQRLVWLLNQARIDIKMSITGIATLISR